MDDTARSSQALWPRPPSRHVLVPPRRRRASGFGQACCKGLPARAVAQVDLSARMHDPFASAYEALLERAISMVEWCRRRRLSTRCAGVGIDTAVADAAMHEGEMLHGAEGLSRNA